MSVGDLNARVGKASKPDDIIGQYGEGKKNTSGVEMLKFLENHASLFTIDNQSRSCSGHGLEYARTKENALFWTTL